jgi:hypothetical protein
MWWFTVSDLKVEEEKLHKNIHKTYGVYPDLSWKRNAVEHTDLEAHIEYNKTWRWGRALIVDGVCVYSGSIKEEVIQKWIDEKLPTIDKDFNPTKHSAPYQ